MKPENDKYSLLMEHLSDAFACHQIITDDAGNPVDYIFLDVNRAFEEMFNLPRSAVTGKKITKVFPNIKAAPFDWNDAFSKVALTGETLRFEHYYKPRDRWYKITVYSDEPGFFAVLFRDITENKEAEQKKYEQALRESEEKHRRLFETMAQGVIYQAADGAIISANPAAERILGLSLDQMQGKTSMDPHWQMIEEDGTAVPGTEHPTMIALRAGQKVGPVTRGIFHASKNAHVWLNITAIPLFQPGETKPFQAYATFEDITERKQAEEKLKEEHNLRMNLLDNIPGCIALIIKRETREIVASNKAAQEIGAVPGEKCYKTCAKRDDKCPFCLAHVLWATGELKETEVKYQGTWYLGIWAPLSKELYVHYIFDISKRKQAEQKLADHTLELEQLYHQLDKELDKARQVHERTLPTTLPTVEGISFAAHYQPAQKMGGDLYDVIHKDNKLIFYISDVSGHSLDGAMLSVFIKEATNSYINLKSDHISPHQILKHLSKQYGRENYDEELYFCIFMAVLDLGTFELSYCSAGFQQEMLLRLGNGEALQLATKGLFITSYMPPETLTLKEETVVITPGTSIFLTSDGLTEQGSQGAYYRDRLPDAFFQSAHLPAHLVAQALLDDFRQFNNGSLQGKDDITFLVLQVDK